MNVTYEKKNKMTFIGYHTEIKPEEAYQKCPVCLVSAGVYPRGTPGRI